jgi:hypothetical protein
VLEIDLLLSKSEVEMKPKEEFVQGIPPRKENSDVGLLQ